MCYFNWELFEVMFVDIARVSSWLKFFLFIVFDKNNENSEKMNHFFFYYCHQI